MAIVHVLARRGPGTHTTSEVKIFVKTVNSFQVLTSVIKSTILVVEKIVYPPLLSVLLSSSIFRHESSLTLENKSSIFGYFTSIHTCITQTQSKNTLTFDSVTIVKMSFCWRHSNCKCKAAFWLRLQVIWEYSIDLFVILFCSFEPNCLGGPSTQSYSLKLALKSLRALTIWCWFWKHSDSPYIWVFKCFFNVLIVRYQHVAVITEKEADTERCF